MIALMALAAIGAAGCTGDQGKQGPPGPPGPVGPPGTGGGGTGPTGPTGIEQGANVSLGNGSALTADQVKSIGTLVATIDKASVTTATAVRNPVIEFTLKTPYGGAATGLAPSALGATIAKLVPAANGMPAHWQSYVNTSQTSASGPKVLPSAVQATMEYQFSGNLGTLEELTSVGPGKYRYTYKVDLAKVTTPLAVAYAPSQTHRVGLEIRLSGAAEALGPDNPVKDFAPDGGAGSGSNLVAATANCADCHVRFEMHGGPRRTVEYCVTCHNPGTVDPDSGESLDLAYMAHSLHSGELRGDPVTATSATNLTLKVPFKVYGYQGSLFDSGEITYPQSRLFCETCHTKSTAAPNGDDWKVKSGASQCGGCHITGLKKTPDANTGLYTFTYAHTTFAWTGNDGECEQCHITGGAAGATLDNHVAGARLAKALGDQFKFEILAVTNVGLNKVPTMKFKVSKPDGTPYNINTDKAFTSSGASLNLYLAWDTKDISNALPDGSTPGLNSAGAANTRGYTYRMQIAQIKAAATTAGQPAADGTYTIPYFTALPVDTANVMVVMDGHPKGLPPGETDWTKSVNAAAHNAVFYSGAPRARLVSEANCNKCHELVSAHGTNRNGDPQGCLVCHNSSGGYSDSANIGGPIAMGAFIHNLHMGKVTAIGAITYPQSLANCQGCHVAGSYYTARADALPISTGPGANLSNVFDDTWDSASAGTCGACHDGDAAKAHMTQQGGSFGNVGGKTLTPSVAQESCSVCHGAGRVADTAVIHAAQ